MHVERKTELRNFLQVGDKRCKLVEPRNIKSSVWRFFNLVSFEGKVEPYACCKTCGDLLSYTAKTGTGSLLRHRCLHANNGRNVRVAKPKAPVRETLRVAKPKQPPMTQADEAGALPPKWESFQEHDEISDDIKDIIYSEDPLCYSPIQEVVEEETGEKLTLVTSDRSGVAPVIATSMVAIPASASTPKLMKSNLDTSIDRLATVSEQLTYVIQHAQEDQNKDDDYYFALSLVPIMRQLSLSRKLYVRSKFQEILFKESENPSPKQE